MRIVCLHAHPDDAEILAGGALALLAQAGHQVVILTMTSGDCGSTEHSPEEIADAVVFLSSGRASFIAGANIVVENAAGAGEGGDHETVPCRENFVIQNWPVAVNVLMD